MESVRAQLLQSSLTLCDPMDCSPPGSSVHGIFQTRILEWVAMPFSRGSSQLRDWTSVSYDSCIGRRVLYHWAPWEALIDSFHQIKKHFDPYSSNTCQRFRDPLICDLGFLMLSSPLLLSLLFPLWHILFLWFILQSFCHCVVRLLAFSSAFSNLPCIPASVFFILCILAFSSRSTIWDFKKYLPYL